MLFLALTILPLFSKTVAWSPDSDKQVNYFSYTHVREKIFALVRFQWQNLINSFPDKGFLKSHVRYLECLTVKK